MIRNLITIAIISGFILGCRVMTGVLPQPVSTSTAELQTNKLPTLTGSWKITMNHSGGIMGVSRSIEINSDGTYTVSDERTAQIIQGQLSQEELSNLMDTVASSEFISNNEPYGCADCFIYNIKISGDTRFSAQVDDVTIEKSGLQPLITKLRNIMDAELK